MKLFKNKLLSKPLYFRIFIVLTFVFILGCLIFGLQPGNRLMLCWIISNGDGRILHSTPSTDGSYIVHVVRPDCGQDGYSGVIYDCSTRIDFELEPSRIIRGVFYLEPNVCDAEIKWIDQHLIEITQQNGEKLYWTHGISDFYHNQINQTPSVVWATWFWERDCKGTDQFYHGVSKT